MSTPMTTQADVVTAAMSIAKDAAEGRLAPAALEQQLETELRALVGVVVGEGDPLYGLQCEIARGVLAIGGIPVDEQAEWLAVARHRAGEPVSEPEPDITLPDPGSAASGPHSTEDDELESVIEPVATPVVVAVPVVTPRPVTPLRPADTSGGYDPLRGWDPGGTRRR